MNSSDLLELHDLLQQKTAVIEQQSIVIEKLLLLLGENVSIEGLLKK